MSRRILYTALSGNVFTAIDMVQNIADTITLKLAPELLAELGAGTHVFTIVLGGGYEIQVTVVVA